MKFLSSYRNLRNRTKDNILKAVCLSLLVFAWISAALFVSNSRANAAQSQNETISSSKASIKTSIQSSVKTKSKQTKVEDDEEDAGVIPDEEDIDESIEVDEEKVDDEIVSDSDSDDLEGYGGAPSNIPDGALSKPDDDDVPLIEDQKEDAQETEAQTESKPVEKQISDYSYDEGQAVALAQLMWAEARGCSKREQSLIAWTVLNRVDVCYDGMSDFWSILTAPNQFAYYSGNPYEEYEYRIAVDVLQRWAAEKDGVEDSGRTLPKGYLYYWGDGAHNYFGMNGFSNDLWFGLGDPYENW